LNTIRFASDKGTCDGTTHSPSPVHDWRTRLAAQFLDGRRPDDAATWVAPRDGGPEHLRAGQLPAPHAELRLLSRELAAVARRAVHADGDQQPVAVREADLGPSVGAAVRRTRSARRGFAQPAKSPRHRPQRRHAADRHTAHHRAAVERLSAGGQRAQRPRAGRFPGPHPAGRLLALARQRWVGVGADRAAAVAAGRAGVGPAAGLGRDGRAEDGRRSVLPECGRGGRDARVGPGGERSRSAR